MADRSSEQVARKLSQSLDGKALSRRSLLVSAGALGGGALLAACGGGGSSSSGSSGSSTTSTKSGTIVVVDGGGTYHNALAGCCYAAFEGEPEGARILSTSYDYSIGAIRSDVNGAKEWDAIVLGQAIDEKLASELFQPIDYKVVGWPGTPKTGKFKYYVEDMSFSHVVAFNTEKVKGSPEGWKDFWDTNAFPGARGLYNWPVGTMEIALLADGVSKEELYPLDVNRAFKSIDKLRSNTEVQWYLSGTEQIQFLTEGIAPLVAAWGGRVLAASAEGNPLEFLINEALAQASYWGILKTAPNPTEANKFINFKISPEIEARNAVAYPGDSPGNPEAFKYIEDKELLEKLPTNPALSGQTAGSVDAQYWAEHFDENLKAWENYTSSL